MLMIYRKTWPALATVIYMIVWSVGVSAQEPRSKTGTCEVCLTRSEFSQSERDAAKADRFDQLQKSYQTCDAARHEARGAATAEGRRAARCLNGRLVDARAFGALEKELKDERRKRWLFGAGGLVAGLLVALGIAAAF